jgi:hypothetical protein
MKKIVIISVVFAILGILKISSCKKADNLSSLDLLLYEEVSESIFTYSILTPNIVVALANSPKEWERIKFNSIAQNILNEDGKITSGAIFPEGSIIIKESYESFDGPLKEYSIMKKDSKNPYAANGWLWAEFDVTGRTTYSILNKGRSCKNCHSNPPNIDATRTFLLR